MSHVPAGLNYCNQPVPCHSSEASILRELSRFMAPQTAPAMRDASANLVVHGTPFGSTMQALCAFRGAMDIRTSS